jgi:hypothetical protein
MLVPLSVTINASLSGVTVQPLAWLVIHNELAVGVGRLGARRDRYLRDRGQRIYTPPTRVIRFVSCSSSSSLSVGRGY